MDSRKRKQNDPNIQSTSWEAEDSSYQLDLILSIFQNISTHSNHIFQKQDSSSYLLYLWKYFQPGIHINHILSIIFLSELQFSSGNFIFLEVITQDSEKFKLFFDQVADIGCDSIGWSPEFLSNYVLFCSQLFKSLDNPVIRRSTLPYLFLPMWEYLTEVRRNLEFEKYPTLDNFWKTRQAKLAKTPTPTNITAKWFPTLISHFFQNLQIVSLSVVVDPFSLEEFRNANKARIAFLEQFLDLIGDLLSQLSTRRFLNTFLDGIFFILRCQKNAFYNSHLKEAALFLDLVKMVEISMYFEFNDQAGLPLTTQEQIRIQYQKIHNFQQLAFKSDQTRFKELVYSSVGELSKPHVLRQHVQNLSSLQLRKFAFEFGLISHFSDPNLELETKNVMLKNSKAFPPLPASFCNLSSSSSPSNMSCLLSSFNRGGQGSSSVESQPLLDFSISPDDTESLQDALVQTLVARQNELEAINSLPLFPTEELLWDETMVPSFVPWNASNALEEHEHGAPEKRGKSEASEGPLLLSDSPSPTATSSSGVFPLPKLNLSFLTVQDYLRRNFILYRLESSYQIREDVSDAVSRMGPQRSGLFKSGIQTGVTFSGWARMALPIIQSSIEDIGKPHLGQVVPRHVHASVSIDLARFTGPIRLEWENLREHDVVFLISIQNPQPDVSSPSALKPFEEERSLLLRGKKPKSKRDFDRANSYMGTPIQDFPRVFGIKYLRGGEIFEVRDEENHKLNDFHNPNPHARREGGTGAIGNKRTLRLKLDPTQYYSDLKNGNDCYETFNLLVRRDPKENNFKAILETIRDMMNSEALDRTLPSWLRDVFLGNGNPAAGNFRNLIPITQPEVLDMSDTFLDAGHVIQSFPSAKSISFHLFTGEVILKLDLTASTPVDHSALPPLPPPPYRIHIRRTSTSASEESILVFPYHPPSPGPYPSDTPPHNTVRFTPNQVEAIRSGMNSGVTLIVGPPGTGKTDTAVQMISNLYHSDPHRKILLVTHSNAALNDLFEKIMERDIDPRHCLRLGSGEKELRENLLTGRGEGSASLRIESGAKSQGQSKDYDFSKQGRVNWSLSRRMQLLKQVERLGQSLGVPGDVGSTCETSEYFYLEHIKSRLENFEIELQSKILSVSSDPTHDTRIPSIQEIFPFNAYFLDTPRPIFSGDLTSDLASARGCFQHLKKVFEELEDYRAFELLRTQGHRGDYLLIKQARIVAMTCTHAAMTRNQLLNLDFRYDTLIMEEAAQILEVETLIPMLLQQSHHIQKEDSPSTTQSKTTSGEGCRLQRVILIGDHHQLPPVIQNQTLQRFSRLDQSLFARFIRLGVPHILLDKQGRARMELAELYNWKYKTTHSQLGHLESVSQPLFQDVNLGFAHTYQFVHVPYFKGRGEICPTPYFYQNLGEAEYVVATYQYMRLVGHPAHKISIITSYNGQKNLIRDILSQRCNGPLFGMPSQVTTVDKFQGQQNDFILLSLVRTESIGHMRDVRRLVVALSRARLGLYIFGFQPLFEKCLELKPSFELLLKRPSVLQLAIPQPFSPSPDVSSIDGVTSMGVLVYRMTQQAYLLTTSTLPNSTNVVKDVYRAIS